MEEELITEYSDGKEPADSGLIRPGNQPVQNSNQSDVLQSIIDKIPVAIIIIDNQGHIQVLNSDAKSLIGENSALNKFGVWPGNFEFYLDDGVTPYPKESLPVSRSLLGETKQNEEMILRRNGEEESIWISMSSQPLNPSDNGSGEVLILLRDITYRKEIELSRELHIRRGETLYKLSHRIAEAGNDLKSTSQSIAKFTSEILGALCIVLLKGEDDSRVSVAAFSDSDPAGHTLMRKLVLNNNRPEIESGAVAGVIKTGEALAIPSIDPKHIKGITFPLFDEFVDQAGLKSLFIVPLTGRGGVLGALSVSRHHGNDVLTKDYLSVIMDIAYRGALAIENCRLFESLKNQISERLSTKEQLDISDERFRAIFESTTLGIKVLDADGNIQQTNLSFRLMLMYPERELVDRHISDFLYKPDVPRALALLKDLKSSGIPQYLFEHRAVRKDGTLIWIKTTFSPVMKSNGSEHLAYIVGIVEDISERKRTEMEVKELSERLQYNIEMERLQLAQELHDNPMQSLYSVIFQLERMRATADQSLEAELERAVTEVKTVIDGLRATAKDLRPPTIFEFGLENAIRSYVADCLEKFPHLNISLSLNQDRQLLPEGTRLALFRVFQQAMMNVIRHSEATDVKVRFSFDAEEICLEISDNGKGFEVPPNWFMYVRNGHYGIAGAVERMSMLGGTLKVSSSPGKATSILAIIPWKESNDPRHNMQMS
jgi:PAS domain S-box-containing protein